MNRLYKEISEELLAGLHAFMGGEIGYAELKRLGDREALAFEGGWARTAERKSAQLLERYRRMYDEILKVEECVKTAEQMGRGRDFEVDIDAVLAQSGAAGRNRAPPMGYEGSSQYLPPFPSVMLVDALKDESE